MKFVHTADAHLGFDITKSNQYDQAGRQRRAKAIFDNFLAVVRSAIEIEADLFQGAPNIFVFSEPKSIFLRLGGYSVAVAGFPFILVSLFALQLL